MAEYQNLSKLYCRLAKFSFLTGLLQYSAKSIFGYFKTKKCLSGWTANAVTFFCGLPYDNFIFLLERANRPFYDVTFPYFVVHYVLQTYIVMIYNEIN